MAKNNNNQVDLKAIENAIEPVDYAAIEGSIEPNVPEGYEQVTFGHNNTTTYKRTGDNAIWVKKENVPNIGKEGWYYRDDKTGSFKQAPDVVGGKVEKPWLKKIAGGLGYGIGKGYGGVAQLGIETSKYTPAGIVGRQIEKRLPEGRLKDLVTIIPGLTEQGTKNWYSGREETAKEYEDITGYKKGESKGAELLGEIAAGATLPGIGVTGSGLKGAGVIASKVLPKAIASRMATTAAAKSLPALAARAAAEGVISGLATGSEKQGTEFWKDQVKPAITGGVLGGVLGTGMNLASKGIGKVLGAKGGKTIAEVEGDLAKFRAAGVEPSVGELGGNKLVQNVVEENLRHIPGSGRTSSIEKQERALVDLVRGKQDVYKAAADAGVDIEASANNVLAKNKEDLGKVYDDIYKKADEAGIRPDLGPDSFTNKKLNDIITRETRLSGADSPRVLELKKIQNRLTGSTTASDNPLTMEEVSTLSKRFTSSGYASEGSELAQDAEFSRYLKEVGAAIYDDIASDSAMQTLKNNIKKGLGKNSTKDIDSIYNNLRDTNKKYHELVNQLNPLRKTEYKHMAEALRAPTGKYKDIADNIFTGEVKVTPEYLNKALDKEGKDAIKNEFFRRLQEETLTTAQGGKAKSEAFNVINGRNFIQKHKDILKALDPNNKTLSDELDGLEKVMNSLNHIRTYKANSQNGKTFKDLAVTISSLATAQTTIPLARGLNWLLSSPKGKDLLIKLAKSSGDDTRRLLTRLYNDPEYSEFRDVSTALALYPVAKYVVNPQKKLSKGIGTLAGKVFED